MFKSVTKNDKTKSSEFQPDFLSYLPRELIWKILLYLKPKDMLNAGLVCRNWQIIFNDDFVWQVICKKEQITLFSEEELRAAHRKYLSHNYADPVDCSFEKNLSPCCSGPPSSPWKSRYIRQRLLELNWKTLSTRSSKIIKYEYDVLSCFRINAKYIVCSSYDAKVINIYSIDTGKCIRNLSGHSDFVTTFYLSERFIISGSRDKTIKVWSIETGENYRTLSGHTDRIRCLTVYGNRVVSGSSDCSIRIWNYETGACLHTLTGHTSAVLCLEYNGILVISGSSDHTVRIWLPEKSVCLKVLEGHKHEIKTLQFDGNNIVSGSLDSVRIWDVNSGCLRQTLLGYKDCFAFTSHYNTEYRKNLFAFIDFYSPFPYDKVKYEVKICETVSGMCIQTLSDPSEESSQVQCIQFVLNFVLTSSFGNTVKLWDIKTGKFLRNVIDLNWLKDGYYVSDFRASDTKLVCLMEGAQKKFIIVNFDCNATSESRFRKNAMQYTHCNVA